MIRAKYSARVNVFFQRLKARKERGKQSALFRVSGLVRSSVIQSLKIRPGSSSAGAIPHAHTKAGLRVVRFAVDRNVSIIGPIKFPRSRRTNQPLPGLMERGGFVLNLFSGRFATYPARPYMSRTIERLKDKIPREFSIQMGRIV